VLPFGGIDAPARISPFDGVIGIAAPSGKAGWITIPA